MDGVLTDTERTGGRMLRRACRMQGFDMMDDQWQPLIGTSFEKTCDGIRQFHPAFDHRRFLEDWQRETFRYVEHNGVPIKPGARELLEYLRQEKIPAALCSNNHRVVIDHYLDLLNWRGYFQRVFSGEDVLRRKPDPETYLKACSEMKVSPSSCIGVEDSPSGLLSLNKAGIYSVYIPDLIRIPRDIQGLIGRRCENLHDFLAFLRTCRIEKG